MATGGEKPDDTEHQSSGLDASVKAAITERTRLDPTFLFTGKEDRNYDRPGSIREARCRGIRRKLCGVIVYPDVYELTENLSVKSGDKWFEPERMLRFALSRALLPEQLSMDLAYLLLIYVEQGMSAVMAMAEADRHNNLRWLYRIMDNHGPVIPPEAVTLPRLAMTFPYEIAVARSQLLDTYDPDKYQENRDNKVILVGPLGGLPIVLAFPYAGLIIPSVGYASTLAAWTVWYQNFLGYKIGLPFTPTLEMRVKRQITVMKLLATRNHEKNVKMMECLGIPRDRIESIKDGNQITVTPTKPKKPKRTWKKRR